MIALLLRVAMCVPMYLFELHLACDLVDIRVGLLLQGRWDYISLRGDVAHRHDEIPRWKFPHDISRKE